MICIKKGIIMTNKIKIRFFHKAFRLGQERIVICFKEEPSGYWCAGGRFYL